jgi:adenylate cyclase
LALNPSFARGWYIGGGLKCWAGEPDIAIQYIETSLRLSPRDRIGGAMNVIGASLFFSRHFDEAVPKLLLAIQEDANFPSPYRVLAACYALMGRPDEAREIVARLRTITSGIVPTFMPYRNPEDCELLLSGLRLAMGETV